ncbi:MAG: hypothetical protein J7M26_00680 [Armatimonadetes bacterium]|nr:hypothetical protein [Armatimonadota bacterium]
MTPLSQSGMKEEAYPSRQHPSASAATGVALMVGLVVLAATFLPYFINYATCPQGQVFTGVITWLPDQMSYLAWIRQALHGGPYYDLFTPEPHPPLKPPVFWVWLGAAARLLHLSPIAAYHLSRLLVSVLYLFVLWKALGVWTEGPVARVVAFTAIGVGSGLGALAVRLGALRFTADLQMPELWSFSSMLYYAHFVAALVLVALVWWMLGLLWRRPERPLALPATVVVVASALLVYLHPYTWFPLAAATLAYAVLYSGARGTASDGVPARRRWLGAGLVWAAAPLVGLEALSFRAHPILRQWAEQNALPSPSPLSYVLGFGLVLVAAVVALARRGEEKRGLVRNFSFAWVLGALLLAYSYPLLPFARRCLEGAHIFLVILALPVLVTAAEGAVRRVLGEDLETGNWGTPTGRGLALAAVLTALALGPTSAYQVVHACLVPTGRVPLAVAHAWREIERRVPPEAPVMALGVDGMFLPAMCERRVFVGHFHLTTHFERRREEAARFFIPGTTKAWRAKLLKDSGCRYVFASSLKPQVRHELEELLGKPVWSEGEVVLFEVPATLIGRDGAR